ncbi:YihY/virulence factor BrkB family protein [Sporolactobacillus shoreicorticis]|uniref:YihY/virulence factor BrkB family protein n=1 Tax=Sporolactobacillus shoreicorticis TaxID=1923877 RepID=A0ABW5S359_9BACL|nr:YihY/virulence factor BrkB family protein [Sporolactobacillus shoreicorticis]MCO7125807.1 YihY/virulence factor BrkB family protein [Sporolactobacillus shoreicorticis]
MGKVKLRDIFLFAKLLGRRFIADHTADLAATLAYYFLLSLFPLFIFLFAIIPYLGLNQDQLFSLFGAYLPKEVLSLIHQNLDSVFTKRGGLLSVGVIATLWPASSAVNALMRTLNRAYRVEETRSFFLIRLLAMCFTVAMIFAIAMTLAVNVISAGLARTLFSHIGLSHTFADMWSVISTLVTFCVIIIIFAFLYRLGPNMKLKMDQVLIGAVIAGVSWQVVSYGFSFYVRYFGNYASTYGTLGGIIVLMLWFYLTAITIIIGGQINAVIHELTKPEKNERID